MFRVYLAKDVLPGVRGATVALNNTPLALAIDGLPNHGLEYQGVGDFGPEIRENIFGLSDGNQILTRRLDHFLGQIRERLGRNEQVTALIGDGDVVMTVEAVDDGFKVSICPV